MKKRRYLFQWIAIAALAVFSSTFVIYAGVDKDTPGKDANADTGADGISINVLKSFGPLERKEVFFPHDLHTDTLGKINKNCETCHLTREVSGKQVMSTRFKRLEDKSRQQVMDVYHENCITCHKEMLAIGNETGPTELCGECHKETPADSSAIPPMEFDKYLHSFHIEINNEECSTCHHDDQKEASCRYCHGDDSKNPVSMKNASHISCIGCHREISSPTKCSACHDIEAQQNFDGSGDVPRLMSNQPDTVLIGFNPRDKDSAGINPVPFDHKAHEQYQDTCRTCHHSSIESCSTCHTEEGTEKGKMIRAEQAMHQPGSERSCLGCHEINKGKRECAGCHDLMGNGSSLKENGCNKCHMEPPEVSEVKNLTPALMASKLLESRQTSGTLDEKEIPETVTIKDLSSQYGAVELPHRQIISALLDDIKDSKLADYFHGDKNTVCRACHHNSPVSTTPPRCSSCHGKPFDDLDPLRPGLKAAYHQQCMGCHDSMDIEQPESTNCAGCHEIIGTNKLYDF